VDHRSRAAGTRREGYAVNSDDTEDPGLPLTAVDRPKARAELTEWMDPPEFRRRVHDFDKRSPSEELFNDNKYRFLREAALVLAELSKHKQFIQIRLTDVGEEWPDGYAKTVTGEMAIEVTSVQEPGRLLSAEYNPKKKEYKSPKTPWDVPEEEVYKRAESIPEALDGAIRKKVEKHYDRPCALVVNLNIATHGIEQAKIEQAIARTKDKYGMKFQHLWVLWKDKVF
jgi:hypothetical protein